ncbi:MAG: response regulator [Chloroflexi bacterium]|nr:MAG: response regulator [Chloroflexota bacterium]TMG66052.1 MAG: response regulator [Chloroflexota bacterium]
MRKGARPARRLRHRSRSQAFGARVDRVVARPLARDLRTRVPRHGARDREVLRSSRRKRSSSRSIGRLNAGWVDFGAVQELKKRVIVIGEDDEPIAMLLRDALNDEAGYQAVVVADGALVIETVRQVHAHLLILDIMMPGLNGFEVFDRVREDQDIQEMPVLFISAAAGQFEKEFEERGITDVISKPFDLNDLLERVRVLCPADVGGRA